MSMDFYAWVNGTATDGPNFSNSNAAMILRALGYPSDTLAQGGAQLDAADLLGRCTLALAVPPVADDGMPNVTHENWTQCGVRPGYFARAYEMIAQVAQIAVDAGVPVNVA